MSTPIRILAFAGSARKASYNRLLVRAAAAGARSAGAEVTELNLGDLNLPLFNQDLEEAEGQPEGARKLKALMASHDGFLIATPEYNGSFTPLLKNALDWASRSGGEDPPVKVYPGKTAALVSASPGSLGGLRALGQIRTVLSNLGVLVLPGQKAVPRCFEAFDEHGNLKDDAVRQAVEAVGARLVEVAAALKGLPS